jgi:hypothetical protein
MGNGQRRRPNIDGHLCSCDEFREILSVAVNVDEKVEGYRVGDLPFEQWLDLFFERLYDVAVTKLAQRR